MKKIFVLVVILFMVFVNVANASEATINLAKSWTQSKGEELLNVFSIKDKSLKYQKLDALFNKYIDINFVARFSLGKYYRGLSGQQKNIYENLFRRYCIVSYKSLPLSFATEIKFDIISVKKENKSYVIKTNINLPIELQKEDKNPDVYVDFYLVSNGNDFLIQDIKIMETSLLLSFRNKFTKMIFASNDEIDWFLDDFEALVDRMESDL